MSRGETSVQDSTVVVSCRRLLVDTGVDMDRGSIDVHGYRCSTGVQ
jgi:hypothetical protein